MREISVSGIMLPSAVRRATDHLSGTRTSIYFPRIGPGWRGKKKQVAKFQRFKVSGTWSRWEQVARFQQLTSSPGQSVEQCGEAEDGRQAQGRLLHGTLN